MLHLSPRRTGLRALAVAASTVAVSALAVGSAAATVVPYPDGCTASKVDSTKSLCRIYGSDRIETSIAASQSVFDNANSTDANAAKASAVVLSRSDGYADAIAGTPLAAVKQGPLLLNPTSALDSRVLAEIQRVLPAGGKVYLLGSSLALSDNVDNQLKAAGFATQRVAGTDRFGTAVAVAQEIGNVKEIMLATGMNFPDALGAGNAMAYDSGTDSSTTPATPYNGVVLLTQDATMPKVTSDFVKAQTGAVVFAAGKQAAAATQSAGITTLQSFRGADRYDTASQVAEFFFGGGTAATGPALAAVVSGTNFPDALSGGLTEALTGGPLLLTAPSSLDSYTSTFLTHYKPSLKEVDVFGSNLAVSDSTANAALAAID